MANLLASQSCPSSAVEDSPTPPAKRFAPYSGGRTINSTRSAPTNWPPLAERRDDSDGVYFSFRRYDLAVRLYSAISSGRLAGDLHFSDSSTRKSVYQLVFDLIYHREVIEELLIESGFYSKNTCLHGQEMLVLLMTYDYQDKRFSLKLPRERSENVPSEMLRVAEALYRHRVRLNAALARMRVKSNAQTTSQLMSEAALKKYQDAVSLPFHARVNMSRVCNVQGEVVGPLCDAGLTVCEGRDELAKEGGRFCRQERDLLTFSPDARDTVLHHPLLSQGLLVLQDSGSYYLVENVRESLSQCSGDVIVTNCNAGVEVAHIASLLTGGARVIAYGALPVEMETLTKNLCTLQIDNVDFDHAPFTSADVHSANLTNVSLIICLPPSSLSTVTQPLNFILQEGDCFAPLLLSEEKKYFRNSMHREQSSTLAHALTFLQCQHVVYAVRSHDNHETSNVVGACLEQHKKTDHQESREYIRAPLDTFTGSTCDAGYHITILKRKPEDPQPTASEVIAKAITSGVLSGEGLAASPSTNSPQSKKKKRKKAQRIFSQYTGIPMTISAQNKITPKKTPPRDLNSRRPFR